MNKPDIVRKLKIDETKKMLVINAPSEYEELLRGLSYDNKYNESENNTYDFIQVFAVSQQELENLLTMIKSAGKYDCLFWISYPKGGGKIKSDLKRDKIWNEFAKINLRPVSQIAIDETWSALRGRPDAEVGK